MKRVITYGTYDLLHYGHLNLLRRAKALGDYLIVGVTADTFDRERGKINVQQSLMERIEAVKATGYADEIIIEEYEGQKIDDILRYQINTFAIGSDWVGKFDYLREFCEVVYLDRTEGVSSSLLRSEDCNIRIGLLGDVPILNKIKRESSFVNGISISGVCCRTQTFLSEDVRALPCVTSDFDQLLDVSDAVYIISNPEQHYEHIRQALMRGKHVLCESPITINCAQWQELTTLASDRHLILMDAIKTAYSTAYYRLCLLAKSGIIGQIVSVDATCTSMYNFEIAGKHLSSFWNSICAWGPTALLPIFQLLGTDYQKKTIITHLLDDTENFDTFTKISLIYPHAVASLKVGQGVKSEGELVISGTKGYIYVPAPWWKTDYFEVRYENTTDNKRYFYQLDGEGLRYELLCFIKAIKSKRRLTYIDDRTSSAIVKIIEDFYKRTDTVTI